MKRVATITHIVWLEMIRRKDIYVLIILLAALLVLLISMNVFGLSGAVAYVKDLGFLAAWVLGWMLAVNVSCRELPQEESRGTIFPLLAKPVTRFEVVLGKWLGAWTIVSAATLLFYALILAVVVARGGGLDMTMFAQGFAAHAAALAVISAIGVMFSTRMNHDAAATITFVLTAASMLVTPRVPEFLARETGWRADFLMALYELLPHFEVFDMRTRMVHGYGRIEWGVFALILSYAALLTAVFVLAAWLSYRRKRFVRGNLTE